MKDQYKILLYLFEKKIKKYYPHNNTMETATVN